ncbi:MAG TPA: hypothetical protein PKI20_01210 [Verrucomicrobiota bacterium]|mgnify:CR=1 FL=1|jgi:hypothetical protein|nr:hypothetical protein [Verrucomicrobiota bacterium]
MNANAPRIGGIEPPGPAPDAPAASEPHTAAAEAEPRVLESPKSRRISPGTIGSIAAMLVAAGALVCASLQQQKVQALKLQVNRVQAAAQAAFNTANNLRIPKDVSADLASLEATVNKLRAANEARQQSFNEEIKKLPALENRLAEQATALASKQTELDREIKSFQATEEKRFSTTITVLKNQDRILRQLVERNSESSKEP